MIGHGEQAERQDHSQLLTTVLWQGQEYMCQNFI